MSDTSAAVYVVDDDVSVRESVEGLIHSADFRVETFATARELLDRFRDEVPGCLVLDVNLPGVGGLEVQQQLATAELHVPVIFITGHGDIPTSVRAMKSGALEFLTKPLDGDALLAAIRQAMARSPKETPARRKAARTVFHPMVGQSPAFRAVMDRVEMVASTDSTVLILGETGTGRGGSNSPKAARFFSMKSAISQPRRKSRSCGSCRSVSSSGSAATSRSAPTCG